MRLKLAALIALAASAFSQTDPTSRAMNEPVKPLRVIGNIYYVGAKEITSFLITTPAGHILLDGGFAETVPQIEQNVAALGFRLADIKILLNSQAHCDHAGGLAKLKQMTGAQLIASAADADLIARGGKGDFAFGDRLTYEPIKADRIVGDREQVKLGNVTMAAHLTPGHTKGCTTWTTTVEENGGSYNVLFLGGVTIPGYKLLGNSNYPNIAEDYAQSFALLKHLPCDVFLGAHGSYFGLEKKLAQLRKRGGTAAVPSQDETALVPPGQNPFIDPNGYRSYIAEMETAFKDQLRRERAAATVVK